MAGWRGRAKGGARDAAAPEVTDTTAPATSAMLDVRDLRIHFPTDDGLVKAVDGVSFTLDRGKTLGIVGESGSGKSVTSMGIMGLHYGTKASISGTIWLDGEELVAASATRVRQLRGSKMAMIFQDPLSALHPYYTVGYQIAEAYLIHNKVSKKAAKQHAVDMLNRVGIPNPQTRVDDYPHQFSGGMRQRAMIAMALSCNPELLIADEPTTALDVTVQAQILDLMADLQQEFGSAVIIITHDLGVVAELADDILVMYAGRMAEYGTSEDIFDRPAHPYAWGLLGSMPRMDRARSERLIPIPGTPPSLINVPSGCPFHPRCAYAANTNGQIGERGAAAARGRARPPGRLPPEHRRAAPDLGRAAGGAALRGRQRSAAGGRVTTPVTEPAELPAPASDALMTVTGLTKHFPVNRGIIIRRRVGLVRSVDDVTFDVARGETLGIVGESGCGKTTTARMLTRLIEPTAGQIIFDGRDITHLRAGAMRPLRREVQMIFQDPYSSLNPRHTVGAIVGAPLRLQKVKTEKGTKASVQELLELVGLNPEHYNRYPHEFSGGQRQRIGIARTLALRPKLIVADEPVSALDVSIQAQVVNLLDDLQSELGLTYVIIAHDLSVIRHVANRVAVMYLGNLVELASRTDIYRQPRHPYTVALMSAVPRPEPAKRTADGGRERRERVRLVGDVPSPLNPPPACRFHTRCWKAQEVCRTEPPPLGELAPGHQVACHFPENTPVA